MRDMLGQAAVGIAAIAKEVGLSQQAVYRIKDDPAGAEAALAAWGLWPSPADQRRALVLLGSDQHGATEALMLAHGFHREMPSLTGPDGGSYDPELNQTLGIFADSTFTPQADRLFAGRPQAFPGLRVGEAAPTR
jgi:hypothetical protein